MGSGTPAHYSPFADCASLPTSFPAPPTSTISELPEELNPRVWMCFQLSNRPQCFMCLSWPRSASWSRWTQPHVTQQVDMRTSLQILTSSPRCPLPRTLLCWPSHLAFMGILLAFALVIHLTWPLTLFLSRVFSLQLKRSRTLGSLPAMSSACLLSVEKL